MSRYDRDDRDGRDRRRRDSYDDRDRYDERRDGRDRYDRGYDDRHSWREDRRDDRRRSRDRQTEDRGGGWRSSSSAHGQRFDDLASSTILIRGLTDQATEHMVQAALASFWPESVRVVMDRDTGRSRGIAFVQFGGVDGAVGVMKVYNRNGSNTLTDPS